MARRAVITGLGAVTGHGDGVEPLWQALLEGRSAIVPIEAFDATPFRCALGAEVRGFNVRDHVPRSYRKAVKVMARDIELAVGAAAAAVKDAGIITRATDPETDPTYPPRRVGCNIGAGLIAAEVDELAAAMVTATDDDGGFSFDRWGAEGIGNLTPLWLLKYLPNMLSCHVTILHDAQGPSNTITCAEASGLLTIGESARIIERDDADLVFCGGAESKLNPMGMLRMTFADRLAEARPGDVPPNEGWRIIRPYDAEASGSAIGEAAGIIMLEEAAAAEARGARPYAEVVGFGGGHSPRSDDPAERAEGLEAAITNALRDAGIGPADIGAIVPQAPGAPVVDAEEAAGLRAVFGERIAEIPLVTIAPSIGMAMAGWGGVGVCIAALCLRHQTLPARLHGGACPPDLQAGRAAQRDAALRHILVCTTALGGQNAALVLRAP